MNSALQCLSHCMPLTTYILRNNFLKDINLKNPLGSKGDLIKLYADLINNLWIENKLNFSPVELKLFISKANPMVKNIIKFQGYLQHDVSEFLSFFIDCLHEDINQTNINE